MSLYIFYSVQPRHQQKWQWHMQDFFLLEILFQTV